MYKWMDKCIDGQIVGSVDTWTDRSKDGWMAGSISGRICTDGQMDKFGDG